MVLSCAVYFAEGTVSRCALEAQCHTQPGPRKLLRRCQLRSLAIQLQLHKTFTSLLLRLNYGFEPLDNQHPTRCSDPLAWLPCTLCMAGAESDQI